MMEKTNGNIGIATISSKNVESNRKKSFWHINKDMLPYKIHFFFFIGGMGAILPFQSAIAITKLGLTASNLAACYTTQQILFLIFKPGLGYLTDYFNKLKAIITGLTLIQAVFCFCMIIIPRPDLQGVTLKYESNVTTGEQRACDLCLLYQDLTSIPYITINNEEILRESLLRKSMPNQNENIEIQCTEKNSFYPVTISYQLISTAYNGSFRENFTFPASSLAYSNNSRNKISLIFTSFNTSENSSFVCFLPEEVSLLENNSFSFLKNQFCLRISESFSKDLRTHMNESKFETLTCDNSVRRSASHSNEDNPALTSAIFKTYQFWLFTLCLIISCSCITCIFTMSDTACYESAHGGDYGQQRAWGAVSWGLIAPFAGFLNDYTESYLASWCLMAFLCSIQIWNLSKMNLVKPDSSGSILKDLKKIFSSLEFLAFEVGVFMNGLFTGVVWFYLTWFLISIGGNKLVVGLAHTVQCFLGEVPMMFVSGWMIKKLGHFNIVSLALLTHGIRFFIYSYLHCAWWALPVESLHGMTFGVFYAAMTSYAKLNAKPGTEATTQSVLCTTYEALGAGIGCVISGILFDHYGEHKTFFMLSFVCVIATVINVAASIWIKCRKGRVDITNKIAEVRY